jgi:hypothetical protein
MAAKGKTLFKSTVTFVEKFVQEMITAANVAQETRLGRIHEQLH